MGRKKEPAQRSPDEPGVELTVSSLLRHARLRHPLDEELKILQLEKLQAEASRSQATIEEPRLFSHSEDYRTVTLKGVQYTLTDRQAHIVQILHEAHKKGNPVIAIASILEQLGTRNGRWQDTFKSNPEAKKALITPGERKGTLRLNF
jgi:hypothetical protein